jgi:hypothetical protein
MAKFVLLNCNIEVNTIDFSDHVNSVEVSLEKEGVDTTNFGGSGKEQVQGLSSDSFTINFQQDFAAADVNATLWPLYVNGTEFDVKVRPTSDPVSLTNPSFEGVCILLQYQPMVGKPGELSETKVTFPTQRNGISMVTA